MSDLKVQVIKIDKIEVHPNADRLSLATIAGWQCVIQKDKFLEGQAVVYIPVDSILPEKLETYLFPPDSKIKLHHSRIRTIKIRKAISQGMILSLHELREGGFLNRDVRPGDDVVDDLKITKYEPPEEKTHQGKANKVTKKKKNPLFKEYTSINNFKWYPELFKEGEGVVITEKIHGTSFRAGYVPFFANTLWKKIKKFFGLTPEYEFVYGSHRVQLQYKPYNGFYRQDVYAEAVEKYDLRNKLVDGEVIYGEVYGDGIQKGYNYGCAKGERKLVIFDLQKDGQYVNYDVVERFCYITGLPHVPIEYIGPYLGAKHTKDNYVDGPSSLCYDQKIREGVVIKPLEEQVCYAGRKILKYKSDNFLLESEDDSH